MSYYYICSDLNKLGSKFCSSINPKDVKIWMGQEKTKSWRRREAYWFLEFLAEVLVLLFIVSGVRHGLK